MMNKPWKLVLLLTGIFLAGGVTGALITMRVGRNLPAKRAEPGQWEHQQLKRLAQKLDLQPEQVEQLRPIVRRNMEVIGRLRNQSMTETRAVFERMQREIAEKLTPEQRTKFEQMNKEFRERARKFMPDRPVRPGGLRPGREGGAEGERPPPSEKPAGI